MQAYRNGGTIPEIFKTVCTLWAAGKISCRSYDAPRANVFLGIESHSSQIMVKFVTRDRLLPTKYLLNKWS
jgi:hypothetical protein